MLPLDSNQPYTLLQFDDGLHRYTPHQAFNVGFGRGQVDSPSDRDAAEHIIRKLTGVVGVTNRITTLGLASEGYNIQAHRCPS